MNVGIRLRELREAKNLSQGDIEARTGLLRCYVSRVENGHTEPMIDTLEKWAKALEIELYQVFFAGEVRPESPRLMAERPLRLDAERFLRVLTKLGDRDRRILLSLARRMAHSGSKAR